MQHVLILKVVVQIKLRTYQRDNHQKIFWFDVSVDDVERVDVMERRRQMEAHTADHLFSVRRATENEIKQIPSLQ